jgi:hypothetical protein
MVWQYEIILQKDYQICSQKTELFLKIQFLFPVSDFSF